MTPGIKAGEEVHRGLDALGPSWVLFCKNKMVRKQSEPQFSK